MLTRPRFKPHLHVEVIPGEGVYVLSGPKQSILRGRLYEAVAPWIRDRSADEICDRLIGQASPAEVYYVLGQLEQKGHLCEAADSTPEAEAALWSAQGVDPATAARRLAETQVSIRAFGLDPLPLKTLLSALRVQQDDGGAIGVVAVDNYLRAELRNVNAEALRDGRSWLLARPMGRQIWVGPLFRPGVTGCWECLAHRLHANSPVESYVLEKNGRLGTIPADRAGSPAIDNIGWGLIADAVATWVARGEQPLLEGKVRTFDVPTWKVEVHALLRLPYCSACGRANVGQDGSIEPVVLRSRKKLHTEDGGHRVAAPEEPLARYGHHVSPITGVISMLERIGPPLEDGAMHVYLAGRNVSRKRTNLAQLRGDLREMCSGKGTTDLQARASGLCEALERYSGVFRGDEIRRSARLSDLGDSAVSIESLLMFSDRQYRERDAWNTCGSRFNFVPAPFDPDAVIDWSPVWSLSRQTVRYLPTAFCYFSAPQPVGPPFCVGDSNGNAAGNTLEEAILQGFLELVERDSIALWWYSRVRRPGVDLDSFANPYLDRLRDFLASHQRNLWAIDLTADLGIPVFVALSRRLTSDGSEQIVLGFGAHLDPKIALLRAVTELNQMLGYLLYSSPDRALDEQVTDPETARWLRTARVSEQPYLLPSDETARSASAYSGIWADDLAEDVRSCQALVERHGMEFMVLDQTRPEIGLPVVKVVVPGLRHFWARFAPGRLYDVPVRLGWLKRPLTEDEMNPISMFL